ncbi:leucine-rich repeat-containing protein 48 [Limosa lapponica baueri]|uniref:Dynein regulatory complex subunit 3 n=1 Tax=Limosa lapponica baueri TaxID=1758121 RepID=A0A2I0TSY0_LIMLA|nr:leucine-rich repeat-containing protein 48 [Limosa lapponica baueri]
MSDLYNDIEPNVIDDEMVQKAIEEQFPEDIGKLAKREGINFKDVTELQLSFRNILQIDNLWQFENLTKLQLDNNIIEKIEALESLVHLVWLDLSFNNIEVIEGLDTLVKLQDLSLSNNRISKIEHMDALQELQIFSIGKNNLTTLEDREAAVLKYQDFTELLEREEAQALAQLEEEQAKQKELEYHKRLDEIHNAGSYDIADSKRDEYREDILQLSDALMALEMLIADQLECRDLENRHHEELLEISITTQEKSLKNELDEDLPADVQMLLVDENTIVNAVNASHGIRLLKIDKRESDILSNIYHWQTFVTEKAVQNEIDRNRERIREIVQYIDNLQEELDNLEIMEPMV